MTAPAPPRIPFAVIGGFLGAGKTTLLQRLLRENADRAEPRRIAVLVNDFGEINLDAALVERAGADTIALTNGCVCCQIGGDLALAIARVVDAEPRFERIVVEASGVSDPWKIAQIGRADPGLSPEAIVVLVDAASVLAQAADPLLADTLERQLARADVVLLNKADLVDAEALSKARAWAEGAAGGVAVFETVDAASPMPLFDADWPARERSDSGWTLRPIGVDARAVLSFESHRIAAAGVFSADALRALTKAMPTGVLRLKGIVRTAELGWAELQVAGRHGTVRRLSPGPEPSEPGIVAIGVAGRVPVPALEAALAAAMR